MMQMRAKLTTQRFTLEKSCAALCQPMLSMQRTTLSIVKLSVILSKLSLEEMGVIRSWCLLTLKFKEGAILTVKEPSDAIKQFSKNIK